MEAPSLLVELADPSGPTGNAPAEHPQFGAFHSGELPYVFDNLPALNRPWTAADRQLAASASSYWAAFAATGIPSANSLPAWPAYQPGSLKFMVFGEHPEVHTVSATP